MSGPEPSPAPPSSARGALVALIVVALLIAGVVVIVNRIGSASRVQDCVQSGRTNCAPVRGDPGS